MGSPAFIIYGFGRLERAVYRHFKTINVIRILLYALVALAAFAIFSAGVTRAQGTDAPASTANGPSQTLRQVTVGVPKSFPPYYLLDEAGNPSGFAVAVMNEVAKRAGFKVTYRVAENGGANFKAIRAGDIDIIPSLGINDYRKQYVAFTQPVDTFRVVLFVRDDTRRPISLA